MKRFAIRVSSLGGVFVEEDGGREWGEHILRVEAPDEAAVYQTAEYREAQDLAERITRDEDEPLPPTLEEVKVSFAGHHGNQLGDLMGLGEIKAAAVHTTNFHLLMYDSKQHYLSIAVKPECNLDSVEAEIKSALVPVK